MLKKFFVIVTLLIVVNYSVEAYSKFNFFGEAKSFIFERLSSDPSTTESGRAYYNTNENAVKVYNGSTWSAVGTGSGSGGGDAINIFASSNPDAESGETGWSSFGGDGLRLTSDPANVAFGKSSFQFTPTLNNKSYVESDYVLTDLGMRGRLCTLEFYYKTDIPDLGVRLYEKIDGYSIDMLTDTLPTSDTFIKYHKDVDCHERMTKARISITSVSIAQGDAFFDNVYFGTKTTGFTAYLGNTTTVKLLQSDIADYLNAYSGLTIDEDRSHVSYTPIGDSVRLSWHILISGSGTSSGPFSIKRTYLENLIGGTFDLGSSGGGLDYQFYPISVYRADGSYDKVGFWQPTSDYFYVGNYSYINGNEVGNSTSTDFKHFSFSGVIPIKEWSGRSLSVLDEDLDHINDFMHAEGLASSTAITNGSSLTPLPFIFTDKSNVSASDYASGVYTIQADGKYDLAANVYLSGSSDFANAEYMQCAFRIDILGGSNEDRGKNYNFDLQFYGSTYILSTPLNYRTSLKKGDKVSVSCWIGGSPGTVVLNTVANRPDVNYFSVTRIPDRSSSGAYGFGNATDKLRGLVSRESCFGPTNVTTTTGTGSYIKLEGCRVGRVVTLSAILVTGTVAPTSSAHIPSGSIPDGYRVKVTTYFPPQIQQYSAGKYREMSITPDGALNIIPRIISDLNTSWTFGAISYYPSYATYLTDDP